MFIIQEVDQGHSSDGKAVLYGKALLVEPYERTLT